MGDRTAARLTRGLLVLCLGLASPAVAQSVADAPARLSVFLDCQADCDFDLIREEITYVDWVRDRAGVDVHLLVTDEDAAAGGVAYTFEFLGQRTSGGAGRGDTLRFTTNPTTTDDEERRGVVRMIAAGLAPFVARSGHAGLMRISAAPASEARSEARAAPTRDPWRAWVFEIGVSGGLSGEALYKSRNLYGEFDASRVTDDWKVELEFDYEYLDDRVTDQEFDTLGNVVEQETFRNLQRSWNATYLLVKSLTGHASAGFLGNLESNTFRNLRRAVEGGPAVEYNFFPYRESTRRELVFRYSVAYEHNRYVDTTIFDRMRETLPLHVAIMNYRTQAPWGEVSFDVEHRNYINDAAKRNTNIDASFDVRIFKGLELEMSGGYSWIRDQITLRKGSGSQVDVLLRRRELLTGYDYYGNVGFSYTFGSIFNSVVNPRF